MSNMWELMARSKVGVKDTAYERNGFMTFLQQVQGAQKELQLALYCLKSEVSTLGSRLEKDHD